MHSGSFKCDNCGMAFSNSEELLKHEIIIHIDKMLQCQSCGKVFDNVREFQRHASKVHSNTRQDNDSKLGKEYMHNNEKEAQEQQLQGEDDDMESLLFQRMTEEEKARKRTRGPYRKSTAVA